MKQILLDLIAKNMNNKEIAKELGVHAITVARTKKRLGITDSNSHKRSGRKPKIS